MTDCIHLKLSWQKRHQRIIQMMDSVAGERVYDLNDTLSRISSPAIRRKLLRLNVLNSRAVENYYKREL